MSACCECPAETGTGKFFSRWSKKYAKKVRKGKIEKVQELLLDGVRRAGLRGQRILDVGCGAGALHLALLKEGAASAIGVDMSGAMLEQARTIAAERNLAGLTTYVQGDVVDLDHSIPTVDVTFMDKVVCCYEHLPALVRVATKHTARMLALSHPADTRLVKSLFKTQIFFSKLFKTEFRPWWHDWKQMEEMIEHEGLRLKQRAGTLMWTVLVFERV